MIITIEGAGVLASLVLLSLTLLAPKQENEDDIDAAADWMDQ